MKILLYHFLKRKAVELISELYSSYGELTIELSLDMGDIHSIEYDIDLNDILLHHFTDDGLDLVYEFEDLEENDMLQIIDALKSVQNF